MRGFFGGILTLIALQVFSSSGGPEAGGKLVGWINTGLKKALSGDIAAIPTRATAPPPSTSKSPTQQRREQQQGYIGLPSNPRIGTIDV